MLAMKKVAYLFEQSVANKLNLTDYRVQTTFFAASALATMYILAKLKPQKSLVLHSQILAVVLKSLCNLVLY